MVVVGATAGADGDVVEATRHQGVEDALRAGLGHGHSVQRPVVVAQRHQVAVHITWRWPPRHAEEVRLAVVADRHLAHGSGDWVGTRGGVEQKLLFLASFLWLLVCLRTIFEQQMGIPQRIPVTISVFGSGTHT